MSFVKLTANILQVKRVAVLLQKLCQPALNVVKRDEESIGTSPAIFKTFVKCSYLILIFSKVITIPSP